ncbi:efflux RND transporter permease subunit [Teredinibacter sp. KSP-S5-2]|uniref:efflux RND transporter permease subunit n=1 Tax=Teredinibacter sp. KSP-S5-2 TaxID=3034506 RepID=UPI0029351978|nr:efflux RND transporter permease subunit [Teredinibacter sp. KSP-S5-2]WNO07530.1 efflux RND transporter permease subunit [Teredinibacter sp. KSP-S5-2]
MDIARYFITNKTTSWLVTAILLLGGAIAFFGLGRLEDPQFTIKQAMVVTLYPGASPMQVEEEVTYPIENAIQQLPYVDNVKSYSTAGLSQVMVEMHSHYRKNDLQQIWDELRRKINDLTPNLPPGVNPPMVEDDFGDVFGILIAVTGEGYNQHDLSNYVDYLRRELVLVEGVGKVDVQGKQQEQVIVEISRAKLSSFGISPDRLSQILNTQNQVSNAGRVSVGSEIIRFHPTGEFQSVEELESLIISNPGAAELIYLGDVAKISRDFIEIPDNVVRYNGKPTLLIGISFSPGVNVVDIGHAIDERIQELDSSRPAGMDLEYIYNQPNEVDRSVSDFILNLVQAVAIVIVVLFIFMGMRSGILIGFILLVTVFGSFIFMKQMDIELQRISLGALIIALGMLVDNAIVITEGILIGIQRKMSKIDAASLIVRQTKWPLLGATIIAVCAFAPIGLSSDATGEFAGSLFWVLLISLLLSWVTAITVTPFFADFIFAEAKQNNLAENIDIDPYSGTLFVWYKKLLSFSLKHAVLTCIVMVALLVASVLGFGMIKQSFFPPSTTPMFMLDLWYRQGTDIRSNSKITEEIENHLLGQPGVEQISTTVGRGATRFMLTYETEKYYESYSQLIIRMSDLESIDAQLPKLIEHMNNQHPEVAYKIKRLEVGPSTDAKIEARFTGPDPAVLRELADQTQTIFKSHPDARNIRHDWRQLTKVLRPEFNEPAARRVGISKQDLDSLLLMSFNGIPVGLYRDGTDLLPIVIRPPEEERTTINSLKDLQIYSAAANQYIPITQVVSEFKLQYENPIIVRRDRKRTLTVLADPSILGEKTAADLFSELRPKIEAIPLPEGYKLEWGGEYEASTDAQVAVFSALPLGYIIMFIITVLLFNSFRSAGVIWVTVPLAMIGVTSGLLITNQPFTFMALLGFLSLSGMMIKNGIVLVEQIAIELEDGKSVKDALFDAGVSRVRPVSMAAVTTILGMIPLLFDAFFVSMAVVIMFGLGFATVLTLIFVPVAYKIIYKVDY